MKLTILSILMAFLMLGCDNTHVSGQSKTLFPMPSSAIKSNTPASQSSTHVLSTCDQIKAVMAKDSQTIMAAPKTYDVEREFQRFLRHDCQGHLISDKIETVQSPHFDLNLKNPNGRSADAVLVLNDTTCDWALTDMPNYNWPVFGALSRVTGDGKSISIKGDMADATFTFHMSANNSNLLVRYYHDCSPAYYYDAKSGDQLPDGRCAKSYDYTTVIYPITVNYSEKTLPGFQTVDEPCPTSTPTN